MIELEAVKFLTLLALANSIIIIGFYESCKYELKKQHILRDSKYETKEVFKYKMIFWRIGYYGDKILGDFWSKPFYSCCTCMASIHSTYIYWAIFDFSLYNLIQYLIYILLLAGMCTIIANKIYQ